MYVVWEDDRNGAADLFLNYSNNGGASWQANDIRIDTGNAAGRTTADSPEVCCDGLTRRVEG